MADAVAEVLALLHHRSRRDVHGCFPPAVVADQLRCDMAGNGRARRDDEAQRAVKRDVGRFGHWLPERSQDCRRDQVRASGSLYEDGDTPAGEARVDLDDPHATAAHPCFDVGRPIRERQRPHGVARGLGQLLRGTLGELGRVVVSDLDEVRLRPKALAHHRLDPLADDLDRVFVARYELLEQNLALDRRSALCHRRAQQPLHVLTELVRIRA
jgi:hypothetical protein